MSDRYWIKPAGDTYAPSSLVCLVVDTKEQVKPGSVRISDSRFNHVCVVTSNRKKGHWTDPAYRRFDNPDDFWLWLHSYGQKKRQTYVYAPIASNALTLLHFWDLIDAQGAILTREQMDRQSPFARPDGARGPSGHDHDSASDAGSHPYQQDPAFRIANYVITGKVDILKYRTNERSFSWASSRQYIDIDENVLADTLGFTWSSQCYSEMNPTAVTHNAKDRAYLWMKFHQTLVDWWLSIDGGPWGSSISQLAYSFWRHRIPPQSVLAHGNTDAQRNEELAAFGGRASVWCLAPVGELDKWSESETDCPPKRDYDTVPGPIVHLDVSAMYPTLLATREYPTQLIGVYRDVPVQSLRDMLGEYGVIASVILNCTVPEFPLRRAERTLFPLGRFPTTLTGPELELALSHNQIESVQSVNLYRLGKPFEKAAHELLQYRRATQENGQRAWELLVKQMSVSLSGKLAQRKDRWLPRMNVIPPLQWGQWVNVDYDSRTSSVYRSIAGMAFERVSASSSPRVLLSAYAYLTGYGRQAMVSLRQACEPSVVLSQDTDGLWLALREDVQCIQERIRMAAEPLQVRWSTAYSAGVWLSPVHYWLDGRWTLSGFQIVSVAPDTLRVVSDRTFNPITVGTDRPPSYVRVIRDTRNLLCERLDGQITASGFVIPQTVSLDSPEPDSPDA